MYEKEDLLTFLNKIKNNTVIVEGKRDKAALHMLGFISVFALNGKGLPEFAEQFENKNVTILTDFDREGRALSSKLSTFLTANECRIDRAARRRLSFLFSRLKLTAIEDLKNLWR